jgi:N-acyl-D-aspartate/D-glutamate deacylase
MHAILLSLVLAQPPAVEADYVLRNAMLYDGTDKPGQVGDVAIKDDRIVGIGTFAAQGQPKILDCTGLILTPGFIDLHTHSDTPITKKETAPNLNYLRQGVTTIVTGNCGFGPANVEKYFATLEKQGIGSNVIHQVPHNAVRQEVMGNANRDPTPAELEKMEALVDKGMRDGAWGFATGLIYNPGTYAKTDELIALAKVAAKHNGFYASHIRDENAGIFQALEEVLTIARRAGLRVHVSHIKVAGRNVWGKSADVIGFIRRARKDGIDITADQYPYIASSTNLAALSIPAKYREGTWDDFFKRLEDKDEGMRIRKAIADKMATRNGGAAMKIASYPPRPDWQGKSLADIAAAEKRDVVDLVLEIQKKGGASIVSFGMHEDDVRLFMKEPFVATASDGSSMVPAKTVPHPRSYGTFARKIGRYALEDKAISLELALRSCNGLPADILRLPKRGYLKVGYVADLVVLDPKTYRDTATYDNPHRYATGTKYVFVNGRLVIDGGEYKNVLAGKVLRHESGK